jgi:type 1 fimbriae regulatory protein FimE
MRSNVLQVSFSGQTKEVVRTTPLKPTNKESGRSREYLELKEINSLVSAVSNNRHALRDKLIILMSYRHGLRVSEMIDMQWSQVNFTTARLHVNRSKNGEPSKQPIDGDELRMLRELHRQYPESPFVFCSSNKEGYAPLSENGVFKMIRRAGVECGLPKVHPHMLRHSCGYRLANKGVDTRAIQDYLGHKNIQHTVKYTKLAENRFSGLEKLF